MLKRLATALLLAALAACTRPLLPMRYDFAKTTAAANASPKPPTCEFDLLSARPARPFEEIGLLERHRYELGAHRSASTAAEFRETVASDVCAAGGDAVITQINSEGFYARGTVIRFTE